MSSEHVIGILESLAEDLEEMSTNNANANANATANATANANPENTLEPNVAPYPKPSVPWNKDKNCGGPQVHGSPDAARRGGCGPAGPDFRWVCRCGDFKRDKNYQLFMSLVLAIQEKGMHYVCGRTDTSGLIEKKWEWFLVEYLAKAHPVFKRFEALKVKAFRIKWAGLLTDVHKRLGMGDGGTIDWHAAKYVTPYETLVLKLEQEVKDRVLGKHIQAEKDADLKRGKLGFESSVLGIPMAEITVPSRRGG
jgi:hypothetical protein